MLIGTPNGGRAALIVLAVAIATYAAWRFWEGFVGQGYDDTFSNLKNFFKFRSSSPPIVQDPELAVHHTWRCAENDLAGSARWSLAESTPHMMCWSSN